MAIFSAGVAMNFAFAIVLFAIAFGLGVRFVEPRIGAVVPNSPAWHAGMLEGDRIAGLDGHAIVNFDQIGLNIAFADVEAGVELELERGTTRLRRRIHPVYDDDQGAQWIGVMPASRKEVVVKRDGPAWDAGLRSGDRITRIGATLDVDGNGKLLEALRKVEGDEFDIEYERDGARHTGRIKAEASEAFLMGIVHGATKVEAVRTHAPADGESPSAAALAGLLAYEHSWIRAGQAAPLS
jgi:regulator of sigma E protease